MTDEMSLAVFDPPKAMVADLVKKDASQEFDHTTPEGETALRSWVRRVRGGKGDLEKVRVAAKADALAFGKKVDALAKELKAPLEKIISERMKPLDEIEDAKRAAAEATIAAERVEAERVEAERLADLKKREDEVARKEAEQKVAEDAANAEQRETERVARETRIADEAAANARKEAEEKAERERLAAIAAAHAEQHRLDDIERKRVADKEHQATVETRIIDAFRMIWDDGNTLNLNCRDIVDAIKEGKIPHVTINY